MRATREAEARALCVGCPLRQECFNGALDRREVHGIWGGHPFPYDARREASVEARRTSRRIAAAARGRAVPVVDSGRISAPALAAQAAQEAPAA